MKATVETIREIVKVLTPEEQQLLKDTFLFGGWGDTETEFLNAEGKTETVKCRLSPTAHAPPTDRVSFTPSTAK